MKDQKDSQLTVVSDQAIVAADEAGGRMDQHPVFVYLAGLVPSSRDTQFRALNVIAYLLTHHDGASCLDIHWHELRFQHTQVIRSELEARYKYTTANRMLSALRGVLEAAWKLNLLTAEDYHKAAGVKSIKGESVPAGRSVDQEELESLLATCENDRLGIRDAAIISVLYACGLRRAELVKLSLADYDRYTHVFLVRGKGNKERLVPVASDAQQALEDWLFVRGYEAGPLFMGIGNRNKGGRMTPQSVFAMLEKRALMAGIDSLSPHDLRRSFIGDLLDAGADIATAQKLAGHANINTTARYDRRGERTKQKAVELLRVPHRKRTLRTK